MRVGPFKTALQIEKYIFNKYEIDTHVYHVHSQRKLKIVYSLQQNIIKMKEIKVNAIYYVQSKSIDDIMTEILVPDVEITEEKII